MSATKRITLQKYPPFPKRMIPSKPNQQILST